MNPSKRDPNQLIASLVRDKVEVDLKTIDICFLAALHLRADHSSLASFEEDMLLDLFEQVCDVVDPGAENPRKRATHAIQRLREQRMLSRIDGVGLVSAGEYGLTRLAAGLVEYYLHDEALTRESLTLLTATLSANLAEILASSKTTKSDDEWAFKVIGPLRITVGELMRGIERRQRGMDAHQEEVQERIAELLESGWFETVDQCQELMEQTTGTLNELNAILLNDANQFIALLQDIQTVAHEQERLDAEEAVQAVINQVDRLSDWGRSRQGAWSEYYTYAHRYLRDVVRLDPSRALSQRLRDQVSGWAEDPFYTRVASEHSFVYLRPLELRVELPEIVRPRSDRDVTPDEVALVDQSVDLVARVQLEIKKGVSCLSQLTNRVLADYPRDEHYIHTGRIAEIVAEECRVQYGQERLWESVSEELQIEDWSIKGDGN